MKKDNCDYSITHAISADIPRIVDMWQAIDQIPGDNRPFGGDSDDKPTYAKTIIEHTLQADDATILIARSQSGPTIFGTISGHVFNKPAVNLTKVGVIYSLWVDQALRKQGIGQHLLSTLEKKLTEKGAQALQVGWDSSNTLAANWWKKRGYTAYEVIASKIID